jgi:uncharacterized protein
MLKKQLNFEEIKQYADTCGPTTKIYIGCDSERILVKDVWYVDYVTAVVIHVDGRHGCKIFGCVERERDYDAKLNRPSMRLMNEVYRVAGAYAQLSELVHDKEIEVHLDINPNEEYGSSCVIQQAVGYIKGTCNKVPLVKPLAFAASYAADRLKSLAA